MSHRLPAALSLLLPIVMAAPLRGQDHATHDHAAMSGRDTSYAAMQERGRSAMGVDQYTSAHRFDDAPDGGRIVLQRDSADTAGTRVIREHLRSIAGKFSVGDFRIPGFVHAGEVPGTREMTRQRRRINYRFEPLPGGGQVRIVSRDPAAVRAIHRFLAFQRTEHRAPGKAL
jgi:hypothetical protein